jgi:hypothetical protein
MWGMVLGNGLWGMVYGGWFMGSGLWLGRMVDGSEEWLMVRDGWCRSLTGDRSDRNPAHDAGLQLNNHPMLYLLL